MTTGRDALPFAPDRLTHELGRLLPAVRREAGKVVEQTRPTPATLHRLHRDLRRLRVGLALWQEIGNGRSPSRLPGLDRRLRHLAQLVGQVRDRDVAVALLAEVDHAAGSHAERERLDRYRARLRDDAGIGRELLRAYLRSERAAGLLDEVARTLEGRPRTPAGSRLHRLLDSHHTELHEKVVRAHRRARRRPSMNRLHRLRIRVRRLRQLTDLAVALDPDGTPAVNGPWRKLQGDLGRLHDLDVLLQALDPGLEKTRWAKTLRGKRRALRRDVLHLLDRARPKQTLMLEPRPREAGPRGERH